MHVCYIHCIKYMSMFVFRINFDNGNYYCEDQRNDILQDILYGNEIESLTPKSPLPPFHKESISIYYIVYY